MNTQRHQLMLIIKKKTTHEAYNGNASHHIFSRASTILRKQSIYPCKSHTFGRHTTTHPLEWTATHWTWTTRPDRKRQQTCPTCGPSAPDRTCQTRRSRRRWANSDAAPRWWCCCRPRPCRRLASMSPCRRCRALSLHRIDGTCSHVCRQSGHAPGMWPPLMLLLMMMRIQRLLPFDYSGCGVFVAFVWFAAVRSMWEVIHLLAGIEACFFCYSMYRTHMTDIRVCFGSTWNDEWRLVAATETISAWCSVLSVFLCVCNCT